MHVNSNTKKLPKDQFSHLDPWTAILFVKRTFSFKNYFVP